MPVVHCPKCESDYDPGNDVDVDDLPPGTSLKVVCPACGQWLRLPEMDRIPAPGASPEVLREMRKQSKLIKRGEKAPIEAAAPSKNRDDDDDRPRNRRRVDDEDEVADRKKSRGRDDDDDKPRSKRRDDDEDDDRDRKKKRSRDEDDDDDRPRSRRRDEDDDDDDRDRKRKPSRDDDDEDDRPRSRRRDEDDDDDDDRDRRRKKRRDDDDDDRRKPKETAAQYRNARQGVNLASIGLWCQVAALGVMIFLMLIGYIGGAYQTAHDLQLLAGLPGLASWIVALVGFSFLIAGPKKGNLLGLTIALVAVAAVHLFIVLYLTFDKGAAAGSAGPYGGYGSSRVMWELLPTQLHQLMILLVLFGFFQTWSFLAALTELARFILFALVLKELGRLNKDKDVERSAGQLVVIMPAAVGIIVVLYLLTKVIVKETGGGRAIFFILVLLELGAYIAIYSMTSILCGNAKDAITYRKK